MAQKSRIDPEVVEGIIASMVPIPGKDYRMGKFPVTQAQYEAVTGTNPSEFKGAENPVENVLWNDCQKFLKKLNAQPAMQTSGLKRSARSNWIGFRLCAKPTPPGETPKPAEKKGEAAKKAPAKKAGKPAAGKAESGAAVLGQVRQVVENGRIRLVRPSAVSAAVRGQVRPLEAERLQLEGTHATARAESGKTSCRTSRDGGEMQPQLAHARGRGLGGAALGAAGVRGEVRLEDSQGQGLEKLLAAQPQFAKKRKK